MKNFWKKTAAGLLALLIVTGSTPVQPLSQMFDRAAVTASAATVGVSCSVDESSFEVITDVKILGDNSAGDMEDLEKKYKDWGWNVIKQDLNQGAGGWYIYLAYKTATVRQQSDLSNAIRDIIIVKGSDYGKQTTLSGIRDTTLSSITSRTFYKCDSDGDFNSDSNQGDKGNLNRGTGSGTPDLYMYYTRDAGCDNTVLTSFSLSTSSSGSAYCYNNSEITADLNPSGNAAYLHLNRKSVSASYYGFTANTDLVYNGSAQVLASPRSAYHGTVYWSVNGGSWTKSQPKATNAGKYTVKSYVSSEFGFGNSPEVSTTVTIARSDANKPTVAIDSPIEAGKPYSPALVGMAADRTGAVTYLYFDSQSGEYKSAQPSTEGTYWVKAKIAEDTNYNAYTTAPVSFKILNRSSISVSDYKNGTVTPDKLTALTGETVTLNISPNYNHFVKSITVNDDELSPVDGVYSFEMPSQEAVIAAEFAQIKSAVVWKNWDGNVLETDKDVHYGTTPEYNGKTPTKPMDDDYIYTFSGWSPAISSVEGDIEYTAQFTAHPKCGDKAYWSFDTATGKLTISGTGAMEDYYYGNRPWEDYRDNITSVEIENGITSIGDSAFDNCANLTSITIPDSVTSIGSRAFYYCRSLESIPIPDSVTSIGNLAFYYCISLESIPIPDSVTNIGDWAFKGCIGLTSITIPDSVTSIGNQAFAECTGLTSIKLPDSVTSIGEWAFYYCRSLESISIPDSVTSIGNKAFQDCSSLTSITIPDSVESIGDAAFEDCESLTSVEIPDSVTYIGYSAFYNCKSISSITISASVTSIGGWVFAECTGLTSIKIPDSVTSIGECAFYNCTSLSSITIPDSVTSIGNSAFYYCTSLESIPIPDSVTSIGNSAFYKCTSLTSVTIPAGVTSIGEYAFYNCTSLTSVTIPAGVTSIGARAFQNCNSLTSITIPDSVKIIGEYAFSFCRSLTSITIPDSVTSIGYSAFSGCTNLTSITIPDSVTSIGDYAFQYCTSLTSVTIPDSVTSIGDNAFQYCTSLTSVTIPDSVTSIGTDAFYDCTNIKDVYCYTDPEKLTWNEDGRNDFISDGSTVCHVPAKYLDGYNTKFGAESENPVNVTFKAINPTGQCGYHATWELDYESGKLTISGTGDMYDYEYDYGTATANTPWYDYKYNITSVVIEDGITSIGNRAFQNCTSLTSITIPDSVNSIGKAAFYKCTSLTSITIPGSVTSIGNHAFFNCSSLTSVTIPDSVESIGDYVFFLCISLTSITIPDSVESIGDYVFYYCTSLTSITIPNSVRSIGSNAFNNCTSLSSITIPASVINIGKDAFYNCTNIKDVYCYTDPDTLTWNEGNCNDFKSGKATVCHVPAESLSKYQDKFGDSVNVTFKAINPTGQCGDDATWELDYESGKLTISGTGDMYDYEYDYGTATANTPWYDYKYNITSVVIEDGITSIGNSAFYSFESLTSITIPDGVTSIGTRALQSCRSLTSVTIPNSVTSIGDYAFMDCEGLTSITIPGGVTSIGDYTFYYCTGLTSVTIPGSVTSIGADAFYICRNITDVYCYADPDKLTWNEDGCDDFIKPQNSKMTVCHVPSEYLSKYQDKFGDSVNVTFKAMNPSGKCGVDATWEFDLDTGKLTISGTGAMYDYSWNNQPWNDYRNNITSVEIEKGITSIGEYAFSDYTSLTSIEIPDSVESIGNSAIEGCGGLKSITIPDSVTSIGDGAFFSCIGLTSIKIPDSVESIGTNAFYDCTVITDVYCYADPDTLTWNEGNCNDFIKPQNSKMTVCHVPAEYLRKYQDKFGYSVNVTFKAMNPSGKCGVDATWEFDLDTGKLTISGTGAMYDYKYNTRPWHNYKNNITSVEIEKGITSIGEYAFSDCTSLTSIEIPDSVESIGNSAIEGCGGLKSITIPDSVTSIGDGAFFSCIGLTSIKIPDSVESIGTNAFYDCTVITDVYCYADPDTLTWNEDGCDDFIKPQNSKMTVCHVPAEYLSKYQYKFRYSVNVTFKGTPTVTAPTANTLTYNGGEQELVTAGSTDFGKVLYSLDGTNYSEDIPKATNADTYTVYYKVDTDNYYYAPQTVEVTIAESYTITWKNGDEILETDNYVNYGTTPEYNGETPTMTGNENEEFVFSGWSPKISEVTGNATYTAQFIKYTKVSAVPATYTSAGNSEYYICSDGKYYVFDGNKFTETAENSWIIPKLEITDEAVISFANITLGGELGLNFYVTVPDDLVSAGAKAVMNGPAGENEIILSSLTKDSDGYYKLTYKLRAIDSDKSVSLKLTDSSGKEVGLFRTNGEQITDDTFTYSIGEYVNAAMQLDEQYVTADQKEKIKAMNTYAAYSVKWKYNTPLPTDGSINELPEVAAETLAKYQLTKSGTANVEITGASLLLDSNTAFKLYFKCDTVPDITLDGKAVVPVVSGDEYFIIVENIGVKDLKTEYTVEFGESYTVKFSALSYAYSVLKNKDSYPELISDELCDLVKAIYAYSESYVPEN